MVLATQKQERRGFMKRTSSRLFYTVFNWLSGVQLDGNAGNYRIFSDRVADGYRQMREQLRCLPAGLSFMGFDVGKVEVIRRARPSGKSSYTVRKLLSLASGILLAHSQMPLTLTAIAGLLFRACRHSQLARS
jgi:polyisoprenyl-phosphate glycosyltransferase